MENVAEKKRTTERRTKSESETECTSNGPTAEWRGHVRCQPLTWPGLNYSLLSVTLHKPGLTQRVVCVYVYVNVCVCM